MQLWYLLVENFIGLMSFVTHRLAHYSVKTRQKSGHQNTITQNINLCLISNVIIQKTGTDQHLVWIRKWTQILNSGTLILDFIYQVCSVVTDCIFVLFSYKVTVFTGDSNAVKTEIVSSHCHHERSPDNWQPFLEVISSFKEWGLTHLTTLTITSLPTN